ncbi:hypothetical protein ACTXT7_001079 [Hymenolepis weldensis]
MYGRCNTEPELSMLMISPAIRMGALIIHPIMFMNFYECHLFSRKKTSQHPNICGYYREAQMSSQQHMNCVGLLVNMCSLFSPASYGQTPAFHHIVYHLLH